MPPQARGLFDEGVSSGKAGLVTFWQLPSSRLKSTTVCEGILGVELNTRLFLSSSGLADLGGLGDPWHDSVVLSFHFLKGHAACEIPRRRVAVASCDVCFVADHATAATAANASALQAVGARALQEALAAELSPLDG